MYFNSIIYYFSDSCMFLNLFNMNRCSLMVILPNFITSGPKKSTIQPALIQHILEMDDDSPKDQFSILSSILNNHTYGYPSLKEGGQQVHVKNITYAEHVLYEDKFSKIGIDGERIRTYIPPSPRNRIMYFLDTEKKGNLYQLFKHILKGNKIGLQPDEEIPQMDPPPPPRKKGNIHPGWFLYHKGQCLLKLVLTSVHS